MAGGARKRGLITEINVTPLVDIMLVLLIIFMLTANLIAKQAIEVELPKASQGSTPTPTTLALTLTREGALYLNGKEVSAAELRSEVITAVRKDPKTQAIIAADKGTSHGRVVWALDVVKSLGVTSFAIQIDPLALQAPNAPGAVR
jgi:biopolymer transport protein TolR